METAEATPGAANPAGARTMKGLGTALRRARIGRHRTPLIAGAALLWFVISASFSAATPIYTAWSAPVNLGPAVNTTANEQGPALSGDGLSLYFYSNRVAAGSLGSDDIWVSQRASLSAPWGAPADLGATVNTTSRDYVPAFSTDGHWMFFASDRPGGFGPVTGTPTSDIYESYRSDIHDDFGWQTAVNLGAGVNTQFNDSGVGYFYNNGATAALLRKRSARPFRERVPLYEQPSGRWDMGPSDARHGPWLWKPAERAPGRAGDLLLLESCGERGGRPVDGDATHCRCSLVGAGEPRCDREQQRHRRPSVPFRRRADARFSRRLAPGTSTCT